MNTPRTDTSNAPEHRPVSVLPSAAKVNLMELRELLDGTYTQGEIANFTKHFSNKRWGKAVARTQVNKFLNGNLSASSLDFGIIRQTLEWLMGIEITFDGEI